jgi:hypothetical protein
MHNEKQGTFFPIKTAQIVCMSEVAQPMLVQKSLLQDTLDISNMVACILRLTYHWNPWLADSGTVLDNFVGRVLIARAVQSWPATTGTLHAPPYRQDEEVNGVSQHDR